MSISWNNLISSPSFQQATCSQASLHVLSRCAHAVSLASLLLSNCENAQHITGEISVQGWDFNGLISEPSFTACPLNSYYTIIPT